MNDRYFIDTNILIYSFMDQSPEKQKISKELIAIALETQLGLISWQVVQEFINITTAKRSQKLDFSDIGDYLKQVLHPLPSIYPNLDIYQKAIDIMSTTSYSFYDCLIISSAISAKCSIIFSEDLHHKHQIDNTIIINPFLKSDPLA